MTDPLLALRSSVERLRGIVESLSAEQLTAPAYPSEWTIADTLSHLGSGAVIMRSTLDAAVGGRAVAEGFNQSVWDEWNAKAATERAADVLVADREFLAAVDALSPAQQESVRFPFGPMVLGLSQALAMRLNEHALHTWDVEVMLEPATALTEQSAAVIVGSLPMIAGFAAKPDGVDRTLTIRTSGPTHKFLLVSDADSVSLAAGAGDGDGIELPAESLVRLVYGRLDVAHTPGGVDAASIAALRPLFPGF